MGETMGAFLFGVIFFGIILAILWMAIPFILMATNRRLDKIIEILKSQVSQGVNLNK